MKFSCPIDWWFSFFGTYDHLNTSKNPSHVDDSENGWRNRRWLGHSPCTIFDPTNRPQLFDLAEFCCVYHSWGLSVQHRPEWPKASAAVAIVSFADWATRPSPCWFTFLTINLQNFSSSFKLPSETDALNMPSHVSVASACHNQHQQLLPPLSTHYELNSSFVTPSIAPLVESELLFTLPLETVSENMATPLNKMEPPIEKFKRRLCKYQDSKNLY
jgi:hypothetical protein